MEDLQIARNAKLKNILEISNKLKIDEDDIEQYGKYKAKINSNIIKKNKKIGKLILVTSINPTPLGEGKTTVAIGLADALSRIGKNSILALREPSMGPVFGIKGGATGGGYAQVAPMEDINLHFNGDIHAITSANNLLAAMIDNHIYHGNELGFEKVIWKRCLDVNDRALRKIKVGFSESKKMDIRDDSFDISVASEIMAIFCLSKDLKELRTRLGNIIVGYNKEKQPITARDLKAEGAMTVLLKNAFNPNLVQTLENTPAIIHGGPFANIAHGCNSIVATKMALGLGDYIVTEAGFGADLGAEKFINIKCRVGDINPSVVVCVATLKALKYHGGASAKEAILPNIEFLENGIQNLLKHINNLKNKMSLNVIVAINKYKDDTKEEIEFLSNKLKELNVDISLTEVWEKGGEGAVDLANKIINLSKIDSKVNYTYKLDDSIKNKIGKICKNIYGAENVIYSEKAELEIKNIEKLNKKDLYVCIAKTQYSFSDDPKKLEIKEKFSITINEIELKAGAGFIVAKAGKIFSMPGLPKKPAAENIYLDENDNTVGIF
ncbi:MAG: formate--tetrahydrofolate ligase [Candidatus Scatovivens sp.]